MQLSHTELMTLAKQEGVHTAGRAAADIVDALLRMDCAEDAAGKLAGSRCMPCCTLAGAPYCSPSLLSADCFCGCPLCVPVQ